MRILTLLFSCLLCAVALAKEATPIAEDPVVEQRLISIAEEMRCLVCQNESLAGSRADLALDLRRELRDLIRQGKTDAEIRTFMVDRYGDFVLYRPPVKPTTWLLWAGPFVLGIGGIIGLLVYVRRRGKVAPAAALSAADARRVDELLKGDAK